MGISQLCGFIEFNKIIVIIAIVTLLPSTKAHALYLAENQTQNENLTHPFVRHNNLTFVNVSCDNCIKDIYIDERRIFTCKVFGNINVSHFLWKLISNGGDKDVVTQDDVNATETTLVDNGLVQQEIRVKFKKINTTGIECSVLIKTSNVTLSDKMDINVVEDEAPIVLDNATTTCDDIPGLKLHCSFTGKPAREVYWVKDGNQLSPGDYSIDYYNGITTYTGRTNTYNKTMIKCVVRNDKGTSSKTFIVAQGKDYYIYALVSISAVFLLTSIVFFKRKRRDKLKAEVASFLKQLMEFEPNDEPEFILDPHSKYYTRLKGGAYGEVYLYDKTGQEKAIIKTFQWPPFLSVTNAKLMFADLINEIRICQRLRETQCNHIVCYKGFNFLNIPNLKVSLILEHCKPGQLLDFLHDYVLHFPFYNDIEDGIYIYEKRIRAQKKTRQHFLATSHLMKWAEQIALAMKCLHKLNVVHRDLSARNILLEGSTIDDLIVKLADFGMSRFVNGSDSYELVLGEKNPEDKPRLIPISWYPPESLKDNSEYTLKSDVWSFGILLWEIFSKGQTPFADVRGRLNLRKKLVEGERLKRESIIPQEIWELMERCWETNPGSRPSFKEIYETLQEINIIKYRLYTKERPQVLEGQGNKSGMEIDGDGESREEGKKEPATVQHDGLVLPVQEQSLQYPDSDEPDTVNVRAPSSTYMRHDVI